ARRGLPRRGPAGRVPPGAGAAVARVVVEAVVAPQLPLLVLRQVPVGVDPRGGPDPLLVVGNNDVIGALEGPSEGDEAGLGAEQAGVDQSPLGLPGPVVQVDGIDGADATAIPIQQDAAPPGTNGLSVGHLVRSFQPSSSR